MFRYVSQQDAADVSARLEMTVLRKILTAALLGFAVTTAIFGVTTTVSGSANPNEEYEASHIIVLTPGADSSLVSKTHDVKVTATYRDIFNGFAGVVPASSLEGLKSDPRVAQVEPNMTFHLSEQIVPTGIRRIGADLNLTANIGGFEESVSVVVGVLDSGVQGDHPDLNVNVARSVDCTKGTFTCISGQAKDTNGHGTHVAGTVGALDNDIGVVGVAPGAEIWSIKVCQLGCFFDHILKGHEYVSANAKTIAVVNLSLGGLGWSEIWRTAIKDNVAKGVVVVVAAGNESADIYGGDGTIADGNEIIPASFPEAMAVPALVDSDGDSGGAGPDTPYGPDDTLAGFSNFSAAAAPDNPVNSPGAAIDMAAPGVNILSTYLGSSYTQLSGTSMASPHAAGAIARHIAANGRAHDATSVAALRQALIDGSASMADWRSDMLDVNSDPDFNHEGICFVITPALDHDIAITALVIPTSISEGDLISIDVAVANNGAEDETFNLALLDATDQVDIGNQSVTLLAKNSTVVTFLWDTNGSTLGEHVLSASHNLSDDNANNNSLTATLVVKKPLPTLHVTVTTDEAIYEDRDRIRILVTVTDGTSPVLNTVIHLALSTENGTKVVGRATAEKKGRAEFRFRVDTGTDGCGIYTLNGTASKAGFSSGNALSTVNVVC